MKIFVSALIDKSIIPENSKLSKKQANTLRKNLKATKAEITKKNHNTFTFLSAKKSLEKQFDSKIVNKTQQEIQLNFQKYYNRNKSKLEKELNTNKELKETSQIVRAFLKEVDPKLQKVFSLQLRKQIAKLPANYYNIQRNSLTAIWDLNEEKKVLLYLPGYSSQNVTLIDTTQDPDLEALVDKVALFNFFCVFLKPTLIRLQEINKVLERLKLGLQGTHYKSTESGSQIKLEMFLRILSAKLNALQNMDKTTFSIFKLFNTPKMFFSTSIIKTSNDLQIKIKEVSSEIDQGRSLLLEVQEKLEDCLKQLKDYFDETKNKIKIVKSNDEFKLSMLNVAEISSDLFIEAELSKLWLDFFSTDIPFYAFQSRIFSQESFRYSDTNKYIISARGLVKNYSLGQTTVYALRGVDLDISDGEFVAIIGNSGAGKTTLLNCLAGLDEPDYGVVLFKGKNLHTLNDKEKSKARLLDMGFIFQNYTLLPHFNTYENVALPADLAGFSKDLKERVEKLLEGVGIDKQAKQYPAQLSGGQLQRVAIARALTNRPKVLFADEPTGDLDSATGKQVMELLKKFHEETKTTIIIITHEKDIADYAQKQINIEDGIMETKPLLSAD